jgi:FkbM family methyltransferase
MGASFKRNNFCLSTQWAQRALPVTDQFLVYQICNFTKKVLNSQRYMHTHTSMLQLLLLLLVLVICVSAVCSDGATAAVGAVHHTHNPLHAHTRLVPEIYTENPHHHNATVHHKFRDISFYGRNFKIRQEAAQIIEWIVGRHESEGLISEAFNQILRVGNVTDLNQEHGLCTPYSLSSKNTASGGKHPHAIVLDIGANAGFYGLYSAAVGCYTFFFDIQVECLDWIRSSIHENQYHHTTLIPYPVGNVSRPVHLDVSSNGCHGTFTMSKTGNEWYLESQTKHVPLDTKMVRLDDVFHDAMLEETLPTIALIKIDTEGFEVVIIASMHNLVRHIQKHTGLATVRNIVCEIAPLRWEGLPDKSMSRAEGAKIICDTLWDAGFQYVIAFVGWHKDTIIFRTREALEKHIVSGLFTVGGHSQDFLFTRTHSRVNGSDTLQPDEEFQMTQKMMNWDVY